MFSLFSPKKRILRVYPLGTTYNLQEIMHAINQEYFEGKLSLPITWWGNPLRVARTKRTLGSYHFATGLIRIHRMLDHPHFPSYFISYIVYHEMLHHLLPPLKRKVRGRRSHHAQFCAKEREFRDFARAREWEKQHRTYGLRYGRP